jgi:tRNA threonylcarbamoyl adenosine modification protein YeaZ
VLAVVLDTSTPAVTAAAVRVTSGVELLAERVTVDGRGHGELLGPAVRAVLADAGARPEDLSAVVVGTGPGPFTGLRVGLVTAAAVAHALAVAAYGVCSLDGIGARTVGEVLVATDARRREVYWAVHRDGVRVHGPAVDRPGEVPALLAGLGLAPARAVGDGALRYADALGLPVLDEPRYPSAVALAGLAADRIRARAPAEALVPRYLRRPDAAEPVAPKPVTA